MFCFFFKRKAAYWLRISDWSAVVCSSDLDGFRVDAALGDVRVEEGQRRGLVAVINLGRAVDPHRDWQDLDVVAFDEFLRQVAGRVDDESDAHGPYLVQGDGHHDTTAADRSAASPSPARPAERRVGKSGSSNGKSRG